MKLGIQVYAYRLMTNHVHLIVNPVNDAGHISPVGAYDPGRDAFLVLDEASFKYPFTWVPAPLLYQAVHTRADGRYRGVLFIHGYNTVVHGTSR